MAGIIDLKGHVVVKARPVTSHSTRQIVLMVDSRYPGIIRELGVLVGTKPESAQPKSMKDFMRRSCSEHCPEAHVHVNDDRTFPSIHRWTITGVALAVVADALEPILTADKGLSELRDEILAGMDLEGRGGHAMMSTINRMQLLGWPLPDPITVRLERQRQALVMLTAGHEGEEQGDG